MKIQLALLASLFMLCSCGARILHNESSTRKTTDKIALHEMIYNIATLQNPFSANSVIFTNDTLRSTKAYIKESGDYTYIDQNAEKIPKVRAQRSSFFKSFTNNSIRYGNNIFCASINPDGLDIDSIQDITKLWRLHVINGDQFSTQYIKYGIQEDPNYCWVAALQFIYKYQHGIHVEQKDLLKNVQKKDTDIASGNFLDIIRGLGDDSSAWVIATKSERPPLEALQQGFPALMALANSNSNTGHIVLLLGATYSFATHNFTTSADSSFIYHKLLIFDPNDGSIAEYYADEIFPRIDFTGYCFMYRIQNTLKPLDLRKAKDLRTFQETHIVFRNIE